MLHRCLLLEDFLKLGLPQTLPPSLLGQTLVGLCPKEHSCVFPVEGRRVEGIFKACAMVTAVARMVLTAGAISEWNLFPHWTRSWLRKRSGPSLLL